MNSKDLQKELRRQRGRLLWLLSLLDKKELELQAWNKETSRQRRYYALKNNGGGRPARKFLAPSRKDEQRRIQYDAELKLLDSALAQNFPSDAELRPWLQALAKGEREPLVSETSERPWHRKIARLLAQFGSSPARKPEANASPPRVWRERDVRERLRIKRDVQEAKVAALSRMPVRSLMEQDLQDRVRARLAVLDRFWTSNHLRTAGHFFRIAEITRVDVCPVTNIHDQEVYAQAWRESVDTLRNDLADYFDGGKVRSPAGPGAWIIREAA